MFAPIKSIEDFQRRAEFFPAGRIVPQRILKGRRKCKSRVKFGGSCYALPTPLGYFLLTYPGAEHALVVRNYRGPEIVGSPYVRNGNTTWWFQYKLQREIDLIREMNDCILGYERKGLKCSG